MSKKETEKNKSAYFPNRAQYKRMMLDYWSKGPSNPKKHEYKKAQDKLREVYEARRKLGIDRAASWKVGGATADGNDITEEMLAEEMDISRWVKWETLDATYIDAGGKEKSVFEYVRTRFRDHLKHFEGTGSHQIKDDTTNRLERIEEKEIVQVIRQYYKDNKLAFQPWNKKKGGGADRPKRQQKAFEERKAVFKKMDFLK